MGGGSVAATHAAAALRQRGGCLAAVGGASAADAGTLAALDASRASGSRFALSDSRLPSAEGSTDCQGRYGSAAALVRFAGGQSAAAGDEPSHSLRLQLHPLAAGRVRVAQFLGQAERRI